MRRYDASGSGRRHQFSADDKARFRRGDAGSGGAEVARRHGLSPQQLFTWRRQMRRPDADEIPAAREPQIFVPAVVAPCWRDAANDRR
ncbi:transposase [Rhodopseudomonas sp.]|uniref:transposase n=1 Tax=Rhodopseudomonas sp. TaxID=1078 RepID=UPI0039E5F36D